MIQWFQLAQSGYNYNELEGALEYPGDIFFFQALEIAKEDT